MRLLHINSYYSSSAFYKNLYDEQQKNGLDIEVYVPVSYGFNQESNYGTYTTISETYNKYDRFIFHLKHSKISKSIIERYDLASIDIVHAHSLFSNGYIAFKLKKIYGIPYIVAVRNTDVNVFFEKMWHLRKIGIEIMREAKYIIFISEPYKELVLDKYIPLNLKSDISDKSYVIPNGIDNMWFINNNAKTKMLDSSEVKLLYVGVIDKNKNVTTTIRAIEILKQKGYQIEFTIVGKVKDKKVFSVIENKSYIKYLGEKTKEELVNIYKANDLFVMPSINETFGLVYAEAMANGLPIIYTRGQGFDGQFKEGTIGYNVDPLDPNEIAEKIINSLTDYNNMSRNCIALSNQFRWNLINKKYLEIYNKVLT